MASAAASPSNAISISNLPPTSLTRDGCQCPSGRYSDAAGTEELTEELHVVQSQRMDGRAEQPDGEVHEMEQQREDRTDQHAAQRADHLVGDDGQHRARRCRAP